MSVESQSEGFGFVFNAPSVLSGWCLVSGQLQSSTSEFSSYLLVNYLDDSEEQMIPLSISRRGRILELVYFARDVKAVNLLPVNPAGKFTLSDFSIRSLNIVEVIARMWMRVVPVFFRITCRRRVKAGLHLYTPFINLVSAYHIASRFRAYSPQLSYSKWLLEFDGLDNSDIRLITKHIKSFKKLPVFELVLFINDSNMKDVITTVNSIHNQIYKNYKLTIVCPRGDIEVPSHLSCYISGLEISFITRVDLRSFSPGHWFIFLYSGNTLSAHALYWIAYEIQSNQHLRLVYSDHDNLDEESCRHSPNFKPDWSRELIRAVNYVGQSSAIRVDTFLENHDSEDYSNINFHEQYLKVIERNYENNVCHIPALLWHINERTQDDKYICKNTINPVSEHLSRLGVSAYVEVTSKCHYKIDYKLPFEQPLISIIIPTRDMVEHLSNCINSILTKTIYENYEVIIVDNQSEKSNTIKYFEELSAIPIVNIVKYNAAFNYSAINNFAVSVSSGDIVCLLNNDTEVINGDWLNNMLAHLIQEKVGVVGAKLLYSDGHVQHAGDSVGPGGCADHMHSHIKQDDPGYCDRAILAQDLSAVTGACLITWKWLYEQLDGLDAKHLPVAFNDVDYCLRVRESGYRVVWTPHSLLYHHESLSRGKDNTAEKKKRAKREVKYMRKRWKHLMEHDPFYNPNLSYTRPDFSLSSTPLLIKPWEVKKICI